jgi:adenylate cyclase
MAQRVLIVQSDPKAAQALTRYFKDRGDQVWEAWELGQAQGLFAQAQPDLLFFDLHLPDDHWLDFLNSAREQNPGLKVILTNRVPEVAREMQAKASGYHTFLRAPFTPRWIEATLRRVSGSEVPTQPRKAIQTPAGGEPKVRVPMRIKITLPYLILALLFALGAAYIVSQVVYESVQDRYFNQLIATGKQTADWMVREEDRLLASLRLMANTQGVSEALQAGDAETLRSLLLPLIVNTDEEVVDVLDAQGVAVFSAHRAPGDAQGEYSFSRGETIFQGQDFVQKVLQNQVDNRGDKYAGFVRAPWGDYFYVSGPVLDANNRLVGVVMVGKSTQTLVREMKSETLGETTLYDLNGRVLVSTLTEASAMDISPEQVEDVLSRQDQVSLTRSLTISSVDYTELLGPWEVRERNDLGLVGVALPQAFLVRTSQVTRLQVFILVVSAILLVIAVGMYLANLITRPLNRLVHASSQVSQGNLGVKVNVKGDDELAVLAHTFNSMVAGLQEGSMYRDLLGRTVSPEVREELRQTFATGSLRLEGQQAVATVLITDIRGFTTMSEQTDPATVMTWLNEYYDRLVPIIVEHGGVVNKFDGDAMLAFFGILPRLQSPKESAQAACQAALEMVAAIDELNDVRRQRGDPPMITGIGINTGEVIAGGIGSRDRLHYTIIGDTVNTTQRLEALTRRLIKGSGVLIGHPTYAALEELQAGYTFESYGLHSIKGKQEKVMVYQLLPLREVPQVEVML